MFALVDCNNFYVSCERIFNPRLIGKPVLVLSNNDGCVIARSNEAKGLGFKVGDPIYQKRAIVKQHKVEVYSSNFALYGDLSHRLMHLLQTSAPKTEVYSIDEIFLDLSGFDENQLLDYGHLLRQKAYQHLRLPVSVGIGHTKTLAKLANHFAKKQSIHQGVYYYQGNEQEKTMLKRLPVNDIWGVGHASAEALKNRGILNALSLSEVDHRWVREYFNIHLARTVLELQGVPCFELEAHTAKQSIRVSRSFGKKISDWASLREAIATYASRAAEKLRDQAGYAGGIVISLRTNPFSQQDKQYSSSIKIDFPSPTQSTCVIVEAAIRGLKTLFRKGFQYKKAGVLLYDLNNSSYQQNLLLTELVPKNDASLMKVMDDIQAKFGSNSIRLAACGFNHAWQRKQDLVSPAYTTRWSDLLRVKS